MKKQKENNKIFKSQLSKTKRIYIHIYFKKCPKGGKQNKQTKILNKWDGLWWNVNIFAHHLSPSFTLFFPVASPSSSASSSSSVSLVRVHNIKMECRNKQTKTNKPTKNRCCRCYGDGGQIHGRVRKGIQRPKINWKTTTNNKQNKSNEQTATLLK